MHNLFPSNDKVIALLKGKHDGMDAIKGSNNTGGEGCQHGGEREDDDHLEDTHNNLHYRYRSTV
jgi:hypothetical protein